MSSNSNTRDQQRATCPACFAVQAVNASGRLAQHGYKRPQQWHSNVGTCSGAGRLHFGTEAGRDFTMTVALRLRQQADAAAHTATDVDGGRADVMGRKRVAAGVYTMAVVERPTPQQRAQYAQQLRREVEMMREHASELEVKVAQWVPVAPVTVTVETKQTLLHMRRTDRWGGKLCASSAMGAMKGYTTSDVDAVTCDKCKARMAKRAERAAAEAAAVSAK